MRDKISCFALGALVASFAGVIPKWIPQEEHVYPAVTATVLDDTVHHPVVDITVSDTHYLISPFLEIQYAWYDQHLRIRCLDHKPTRPEVDITSDDAGHPDILRGVTRPTPFR